MVRPLRSIVERGGRATAVQAREISAAFTGTPMTAGTVIQPGRRYQTFSDRHV
jgi:hypothetical protein